MLIRGSDPISMQIAAVYVDDQRLEINDILALNPGDGWVEIHESVINKNVFDSDGKPLKMLRWQPDGRPVIRRVQGKIRIEWLKKGKVGK